VEKLLLMLHHFQNQRQIAAILFLRGQGDWLPPKKLIAASSKQKKGLDAAIAHRQKTLCWVHVKSGNVIRGEFGFLLIKGYRKKAHPKIFLFRYISGIQMCQRRRNKTIISKFISLCRAISCFRRRVQIR